jgi:uncharacterized protein with FMN-binding domain
MKRALLIAGGTVGGLGAVLAITPPQLSTTSSINIAGGSAIGTTGTGSSASASSSTATPVESAAATNSAKPVATKKGTTATTKATATQSATATPSATTTTAAPAASTVKDGTFTGPSVNVNYGNVQVKITVVNGRITDAVAVKAPSGKNDRYTNMSVPVLKQQTLKAQSANIQGVSGASYTSYGWFTSLQGALTAAGL